MELMLVHQSTTQISVICNGQLSHTFDLSAISPLTFSKTQPYPTDPIPYGQALYHVLFPPGTLANQFLAAVPERIMLIAPEEDLDAIAWEYLHSPTGFLVQECHFVRGLPIEQRIQQPPTLDTGLHIVAIPSNPLSSHIAPLNIDTEWQHLTEIVNALPLALTLERTRPPTIKQLRATVAGQHHRVVHFMGHGVQHEKGAVLYFEKDNGDLEVVQAKDFVLRVRNTTFLVTLNSCDSAAPGDTAFSNLALLLVRQKIPYALGMRFRIPDDDALLFSRSFYADLARGASVEEALLQARLTLVSESLLPWVVGVPVLYTALTTPVTGFTCKEGRPTILEHQPRMEVSALPRAEGTFQGRTEDLKRLGALLTGNNRPRILTIHGGGGQGKTALAREAVERFAHAWPGGVWGTTLENLPDRACFAADLARFLGINLQEISDPDEVERRILARLTGSRTLLVLDNAETLVDAVERDNSPVAIQLGQFLQQLSSASVSLFITSRVPLRWIGETIYDELEGLSPKEGVALFEQCATQKAKEINHSRVTVQKISEKVEGHPLSLRLLGCAFNASTITLNAFIREYEVQLMQTYDRYRDEDHRHRSLSACINMSVRYLNADLCILLSGLWIFHAPFLATTAVAIFDPDVADTEEVPSLVHNQLHMLWQRSLLTRKRITVRTGTLHFYHLLSTTRSYIEHYLPSPYSHDTLLHRLGVIYAHMARNLYNEIGRSAFTVAIVQQIEIDLERVGHYLIDTEWGPYKIYLAWIFFRMGTPYRSLKHFEEVLERGQGKQEVSLTALALNNMALVYRAIGQPQKALSLYEQVLSIIHKGNNRVEEAIVLNNTAEVYRTIGQWERALILYRQTLPVMREIGNREGEAAILNNMALVYQTIGQDTQALNLYEQVLSIEREVGNRTEEAATLNNMAEVYRVLTQWQKALSLHEQALPIRHEMSDRAGEAITLNNMALVYRALGQWKRALDLYEQALPIKRKVGDRAGEALTLNNMARVYLVTGQQEQALHLYEQSLLIMRDVGNREGEAMALTNIAILLYRHFKRTQNALALMQQALDILKQTDLPQDPAGQTQERLQQWLQAMRQGMPLTENETV